MKTKVNYLTINGLFHCRLFDVCLCLFVCLYVPVCVYLFSFFFILFFFLLFLPEVDDLPAWTPYLSSNFLPQYAVAAIRSNRWPGAYAFARDMYVAHNF